MASRRFSIFATTVLVVLAIGAPVRAQSTAVSQRIDTSIRSAGMGGACAAVDWGEPGVWGNPATLAGVQGITWMEGRTRLLPELAPDLHFNSRRIVLGGAGVGLSQMGRPIEGLGRTRLDYGPSILTDQFGNLVAVSNGYEQIEAWGLGISPLQLLDALRGAGGDGPARLSKNVDFAVGIQRKHTVVAIFPSLPTAEADGTDWGVTGRVALVPGAGEASPARLDLSGGFAILNASDERFTFPNDPASYPPARIRRLGFALHTAWPLSYSGDAPPGPWGFLLASSPNAFGIGVAMDDEHVTDGDGGLHHEVQRVGLEANALGLLTGRLGHISDRTGGITDMTYGLGVRVPIGPWGSLAYDYASVPQLSGFKNLNRHGFSATLDAVKIWQDATPER